MEMHPGPEKPSAWGSPVQGFKSGPPRFVGGTTGLREQARRGFTLIELLIVVVIVGILAAIAIPKFSAVRQRAYKAAMVTDLKNLAHLQEVYYNDRHSFGTLEAVGAVLSRGVYIEVLEADHTGWAALATHEALKNGEKCWIFHGSADRPTPEARVASQVECSF